MFDLIRKQVQFEGSRSICLETMLLFNDNFIQLRLYVLIKNYPYYVYTFENFVINVQTKQYMPLNQYFQGLVLFRTDFIFSNFHFHGGQMS